MCWIARKTLCLVVAALVTAASALGQGLVMFNNLDRTIAPNIDAKVSDFWSGLAVSGTQARAALLGGPVGSTPAMLDFLYSEAYPGSLSMLANPVDGSTWVYFGTGQNAGYVNVGSSGARIIPNVGYGQQAMLQMVAWVGNFNDWPSAVAAAQIDSSVRLGCSEPWIVTTTQSAMDTNFVHNVGLNAFSIRELPIPETPIGRFSLKAARVGDEVVFTWPTNGMSLTLQATTNLGPPEVWTNVSHGQLVYRHWEVRFGPLLYTPQFFRLVK